MKKIICLPVIIFLFITDIYSQNCLPSGIVFTRQSQIDSFPINFPSCTEISGQIVIDWKNGGNIDLSPLNQITRLRSDFIMADSDATGLTGMTGLKRIDGNLTLNRNWQLENLAAFSNLENIAGNWLFQNNTKLERYSGLSNLKTIGLSLTALNLPLRNFNGFENLMDIGEDLYVADCDSLENFIGFENLKSLGRGLHIQKNFSLKNFNGLSGLETVNAFFQLSENDNLVNLSGMTSLQSFGGDIVISGNPKLLNLSGLENIQYLPQILIIEFNNELQNLNGLNNLDSIGDYFSIYDNRRLENLTGLENLKHVGEDFNINYSGGLTTLQGIENLQSVGLAFNFIQNENLLSFEGLNNLRSVGSLAISGNNSIQNSEGLENLETVKTSLLIENNSLLTSLFEMSSVQLHEQISLVITNNPMLASCNAPGICDFINRYEYDDSKDIRDLNWAINGNAPGCNSFPEIFVSCSPNRCLPYDTRLRTQAEVDDFIKNYPLCTEVYGNLTIEDGQSASITNVDSLIQIDSIRGYLGISAELLQDLSGLAGLTKVNNQLDLNGNSSLPNFSGLENLKSVGSLNISFNSMITDFTGLNGLEETTKSEGLLIQSNNALTSIKGLDNLQKIKGNISFDRNYELTDIDGFPSLKIIEGGIDLGIGFSGQNISGFNSLEILEGDLNLIGPLSRITGFNELKKINGGIFLEGVGNDPVFNASGFQKLDTIKGDVSFENIFAMEFNGFNNLKYIGGNWNSMNLGFIQTFSGFDNLQSIGNSFLLGEAFELLELNAFSNLKHIGKDFFFGTTYNIENFDNFSSLKTVGGNFNLEGNELLTDISGFSDINFSSVDKLTLKYNFELSACNIPFVCNYLLNGGNAEIMDNSPGCANRAEIESGCDLKVAKLRFGTFYDGNQNGIYEVDEPFFADGLIFLKPFDYLLSANPDSLGRIILPQGNYEIEHYPLTDWELTSTQNTISVTLDDTNSCDTILFGVYPTSPESEMISVVNAAPARCNEQVKFTVTGKNTGTTVSRGTLWLEIDSGIIDTDFIDIPDNTSTPLLLGWTFENLFPGESVQKSVSLTIPGPPDFSPGDTLNFKSYIEFSDTNGSAVTADFDYPAEVRCSYDPNDKLVNPARPGNYTLFDEEIIYTIRFQNTGNDFARDVVIEDELDKNLDLSTIRVVGSSHYEVLTTTLFDRLLTFEFKNIILPDSTADFDGSQGYVSFAVSTLNGLSEGALVLNYANIFFDSNPPIVTNTTYSTMVSKLPTSESQNIDNQLPVTIYPNPSSDVIFLSGNNLHNAKITVTDLTGQILKTEKLNIEGKIFLPHTAPGIFFLKIETEEGITIKKVVKI